MERTTVARLLEEKGTQVWTVAPDSSVFDGLKLMAEKEIGALVVMDGVRPIGLMSERDYARKVILLDRGSRDTTVMEIMTPVVHSVTLDQTTAECMSLMTERRIRHLPVMEDGALVGLISIGDVVRAVMGEQKFLIEQLEAYIWS
jgi:CBS domain-containing protein